MDILLATQQAYNPYAINTSSHVKDTSDDDHAFQEIVSSYDAKEKPPVEEKQPEKVEHKDSAADSADQSENAQSTATQNTKTQQAIDEINSALQSILGASTELTLDDLNAAASSENGDVSAFWQNLLSLLSSTTTLTTADSNTEKLDAAEIASLFSGQISANSEGNTDILSALKSLLSSSDAQNVLLSNLTPEQRNEALQAINNIIAGNATDADFELLDSLTSQIAAYIVQPVQPQQQPTAPITAELGAATRIQTARNGQEQQTQPLQNNAANGERASGAPQNAMGNTHATPHQAAGDQGANLPLTSGEFSQELAGQQGDDALLPQQQNTGATSERSTPATPQVGTGYTRNQDVAGATGQNLAAPNMPLSTDTQSGQIDIPDALTALGDAYPMQSATSTHALTQNLTQAANATQAHPATQMVSATLTRAANAGQNAEIRLMLDPPELGRVEVKMSIDGDNTHIVLTAEKPETYMMLRRDADILQRALEGTGLEGEANLSFEMSQDDSQFAGKNANDNNAANGSSNTAAGSSSENDTHIIETKMDWHIDPNTGTMHYNVVV